MKCPCHSGLEYAHCCEPFHKGALPPTPLALMRSRYAAYALKNASYIIATTHPQSIYFEKDKKKWEKAILSFSNQTTFVGLEIVEHGANSVFFIAHLSQNGVPFTLKEKSHFQQVGQKWLYLSAEFKE